MVSAEVFRNFFRSSFVVNMLRPSTIKAVSSKTACFRAVYCVRAFSTDKAASAGGAGAEVLLYEGMFAKKMKWLRRISLGSTILSIAFMPAAMTIQSGVLPMAAQMALAGTVFFSSFSSTVLLQVVAHPYVCTLHEVVTSGTPANDAAASDPSAIGSAASLDRKFKAMRYNMFGQPLITEFTLRQADRNVSNPFSSFQVKPAGFFYVYGGEIADLAVRRALTKET